MDYPEHEFSKYIDNQFSFNGDVNLKEKRKKSTSSKLQNKVYSGTMTLEPRLLEYLKKKEYNKKNDIKTNINLEQQYQITDYDRKKIKDCLNGKTNVYDNKYHELNKMKTEKQYFPSNEFESDKRVQKIDKEIKSKVKNHGMFYPDNGKLFYDDTDTHHYEEDNILDGRDFSKSINNVKINPTNDPRMSVGSEYKNPQYDAQHYKVDKQRNDPRIPSESLNTQHYNVSGQVDQRR